MEDLSALHAKEELLKQKIELQEGLPFLYGWKHYEWSRKFYESRNKMCFLVAANQIGKSSVQIRKVINWATNKELWPLLWRRKPKVFFYFYPTAEQATIEFETKWPEQLPGGKYKDDPYYGWRHAIKNKQIHAIYFNSGVTVYFKTYSQKATALQTATVDAIFCDEEIPVDIYDELLMRVAASKGFFSMVFTATIGQQFWRQVLEPTKHEIEPLKDALKMRVSMYDCLKYEDGSPTHWKVEDIERIKNQCKSEAEVLRRVYGRFIVDAGRKYANFETSRHVKPGHKVPREWPIYVGIDSGSGGNKNHPAAIAFVVCKPDHTMGRVFLGWRGDGQETTSGDVLQKLRDLKLEHKISPVAQYYDWADKDFEIIAGRIGEPVSPADKSKDKGEKILDTLFKNDMLAIYGDPELDKLVNELLTLRVGIPKTKAQDDFVDALRYAVSKVPWNWEEGIKRIKEPKKKKKFDETPKDPRQRDFGSFFPQEIDAINEEFAHWNELYGA